MADMFDIDNYVDQLAIKNFIRSFSPAAVSKALSLPLNPVIDRLNYLTAGNKLILKYEIRCNDDLSIIAVTDDFSDYIGKRCYCKGCNEEIEIGLDNVFPMYYIDADYREHLKKN